MPGTNIGINFTYNQYHSWYKSIKGQYRLYCHSVSWWTLLLDHHHHHDIWFFLSFPHNCYDDGTKTIDNTKNDVDHTWECDKIYDPPQCCEKPICDMIKINLHSWKGVYFWCFPINTPSENSKVIGWYSPGKLVSAVCGATNILVIFTALGGVNTLHHPPWDRFDPLWLIPYR